VHNNIQFNSPNPSEVPRSKRQRTQVWQRQLLLLRVQSSADVPAWLCQQHTVPAVPLAGQSITNKIKLAGFSQLVEKHVSMEKNWGGKNSFCRQKKICYTNCEMSCQNQAYVGKKFKMSFS